MNEALTANSWWYKHYIWHAGNATTTWCGGNYTT